MKKFLLWFFNLFVNKSKNKFEPMVKVSKIVGVDKIFKKDIKSNYVMMGNHVDFVITVNTDKNESIGFKYYLEGKKLLLNLENKSFDYLKIEYIKVK